MNRYYLVDPELFRIIPPFDNMDKMEGVIIKVGLTFDRLVFLIDSDKSICSCIDESSIFFYEYMFTQLNFGFSFNRFEEGVLKHLRIVPS